MFDCYPKTHDTLIPSGVTIIQAVFHLINRLETMNRLQIRQESDADMVNEYITRRVTIKLAIHILEQQRQSVQFRSFLSARRGLIEQSRIAQ